MRSRVCPRPLQWVVLYDMLPARSSDQYGAIPASPLVLDAWGQTSDDEKRERLREHLQWAKEHGALARVNAYLASLREDEWHHEGD